MLTVEQQREVSDLADEIIKREMERGAAFSEALCNWAFNQALRQTKIAPFSIK